MKKTLLIIACLLLVSGSAVHAAVYEASTLHNAVSRSSTVQDLFAERWNIIVDENVYVDVYGKINWLNDFKINTFNRGTKKYEPVEMRLVRTYGSFTLNYPIMTGFEAAFDAKYNSENNADLEDEGDGDLVSQYWKENNLLVGFTMTGFHYGLTRETTVDRGYAGKETVTDYKYTQFFDDIFAVSLLYVPYLYVHVGVVVNNQIDPKDDGTMSYTDSKDRDTRFFFSSNILSFLNTNASTTKDQVEAAAFSVNVNSALKFVYQTPEWMPTVSVGYKMINIYQDQGYDPVWVGSVKTSNGTVKYSEMPDDQRSSAALHLATLEVNENLFNMVFFKGYIEWQYVKDDLYDKKYVNLGDQNPGSMNVSKVKSWHALLGFNVLGFMGYPPEMQWNIWGGMSSYWDPGVAVHRDKPEDGYRIYGWIFKTNFQHQNFGADFMVNTNYSEELRKLVEASDKLAVEGSFYVRI